VVEQQQQLLTGNSRALFEEHDGGNERSGPVYVSKFKYPSHQTSEGLCVSKLGVPHGPPRVLAGTCGQSGVFYGVQASLADNLVEFGLFFSIVQSFLPARREADIESTRLRPRPTMSLIQPVGTMEARRTGALGCGPIANQPPQVGRSSRIRRRG
jgi:hypothetical protein